MSSLNKQEREVKDINIDKAIGLILGAVALFGLFMVVGNTPWGM